MKILLWIVLALFYVRCVGDLMHQTKRFADQIEDNPVLILGLVLGFFVDVTAAVLATILVRGM